MDTKVVLQVVVVDELGVAVKADVGALTCVLPHVDLEFVLSEKRTKPHFHTILCGWKGSYIRYNTTLCPFRSCVENKQLLLKASI